MISGKRHNFTPQELEKEHTKPKVRRKEITKSENKTEIKKTIEKINKTELFLR